MVRTFYSAAIPTVIVLTTLICFGSRGASAAENPQPFKGITAERRKVLYDAWYAMKLSKLPTRDLGTTGEQRYIDKANALIPQMSRYYDLMYSAARKFELGLTADCKKDYMEATSLISDGYMIAMIAATEMGPMIRAVEPRYQLAVDWLQDDARHGQKR